jgi:hypothetical protein
VVEARRETVSKRFMMLGRLSTSRATCRAA